MLLRKKKGRDALLLAAGWWSWLICWNPESRITDLFCTDNDAQSRIFLQRVVFGRSKKRELLESWGWPAQQQAGDGMQVLLSSGRLLQLLLAILYAGFTSTVAAGES